MSIKETKVLKISMYFFKKKESDKKTLLFYAEVT